MSVVLQRQHHQCHSYMRVGYYTPIRGLLWVPNARALCYMSRLFVSIISLASPRNALVHAHAEGTEVLLRQVDLSHELLVSLGNVVEGQNAEAETEEQESAERDESPEWELMEMSAL